MPLVTILSISSMKTIPSCSADTRASFVTYKIFRCSTRAVILKSVSQPASTTIIIIKTAFTTGCMIVAWIKSFPRLDAQHCRRLIVSYYSSNNLLCLLMTKTASWGWVWYRSGCPLKFSLSHLHINTICLYFVIVHDMYLWDKLSTGCKTEYMLTWSLFSSLAASASSMIGLAFATVRFCLSDWLWFASRHIALACCMEKELGASPSHDLSS